MYEVKARKASEGEDMRRREDAKQDGHEDEEKEKYHYLLFRLYQEDASASLRWSLVILSLKCRFRKREMERNENGRKEVRVILWQSNIRSITSSPLYFYACTCCRGWVQVRATLR